jgi:hypothetical protein
MRSFRLYASTGTNKMGETCSTLGKYETYIQRFCFENLKGKDHSEDLAADGKISEGAKVWSGVIWLRTRSNGGLS